jgi:SAM-dependent methyltransferase
MNLLPLDDAEINLYIRDNVPDLLKPRQRKRKYPTRLLRYLVSYNYLLQERQLKERPLRVCEIGVDKGQMLTYIKAAVTFRRASLEDLFTSWTGIDIVPEECREPSYTALVKANIEESDPPDSADVYLLLHVLEHLQAPERVISRIAKLAPTGAAIIIGLPCHPHVFTTVRERQIRPEPGPNGHVSAFSRKRVRQMVQEAGLKIEAEDGAFFLRASGLFIEDSAAWQRFNLRFGRAFPGWPGEYYCLARK